MTMWPNTIFVQQIKKSKPCTTLHCDKTGKKRGKCRKHEPQASVFYISRVSSNVRSGTRLRLLHLLYDIDFTRAKQ